VVAPVGRLKELQGLLVVNARLGQLSKLAEDDTEVVEGAGDLGIIGPVGRLKDRKGPPKVGVRLGQLPEATQRVAEVAQGALKEHEYCEAFPT
jgi:hypothetical protein